jgi:hypothetical protein
MVPDGSGWLNTAFNRADGFFFSYPQQTVPFRPGNFSRNRPDFGLS